MGRLNDAVVRAIQASQSAAPNPYLQFLRGSAEDVDAAEALHPDVLTRMINELVELVSRTSIALVGADFNDFAQKLGEAHFVAMCAAKGALLQKIPETTTKTADFKWETTSGPLYFEVKTLSVVDGHRGIGTAVGTSLDAQIDLESQVRNGARVATTVSEFAPYGDRPHKKPPQIALIETLLEKVRGNIKAEQFKQPNTFLVVNLSVLSPRPTERQILRPVYWEPAYKAPVSGQLWMLAFAQPEMLIHSIPKHEGLPGIEGKVDKTGILHEHAYISGLLILAHPWRRPAEMWGLFRNVDWELWSDKSDHPTDHLFNVLQPRWNDELDSMGWECKEDDPPP